jgi:hypothetical protein
MLLSKIFIILQVLVTSVASHNTNLTTYLLDTYADYYKEVISSAVFFESIINGTVQINQIAYFFEQVGSSF